MEQPKRGRRKLGADALYQYALRLLSARAHSAGELRRKLEERAQDPKGVPAILARLRQYRYLDDRRFAESYSTARLENQGLGQERVLRDLRLRRVAPRLAEEAVEAAYRDTDEGQLIEQYLHRKYRNIPLEEHLAEPKHLAAVYRRLRHAGFSPANILRVLTRLGADADRLASAEEPAGGEA